ncbi:MAG: GerMN domain-containing protein [Bacilli bacterium]|nr:GerMN domain-containing protein [Bacilli bacterium]
MLKRKAIKKILITTLTICLLLAIYLMPSNITSKNEDNNLELKYSSNVEKINIYLLSSEELLVMATTAVDKDKELIDKARSVINSLIESSSDLLPNGLNGIIPKKTKILDIYHTEGIVTINFSQEILGIDKEKEEKMLEAVTFSLLEVSGINGVRIQVDGSDIKDKLDEDLPKIFTREFGINKKYDIKRRKDIQKVVVYYTKEINDDNYYVPITKYLDDNREKISIIIDDLSSSYIYEPNLVSYLNQNTELINYELDSDTMILNFNTSIFMDDKQILEEVVYSICYSVFDNYNVEEVIFRVNDEEILKKTIKDIEIIK